VRQDVGETRPVGIGRVGFVWCGGLRGRVPLEGLEKESVLNSGHSDDRDEGILVDGLEVVVDFCMLEAGGR
jgi:hypothetical protein